jgi:hypothetical protein
VLQQENGSTFAARVEKLLQRVEYKRADTAGDREAIFRLRYEAYRREGTIEPDASGVFSDPYDHSPNAWLIGIYIDGTLASSIRLHIASRPEHVLPAAESFADLIEPRLQAREVLLDATRHSSRLEFTRAYPFLPYLTMRPGFVAEDYFGIDYIMGTCRAEYEPAFRRMYGAVNWSPPRPYPPLTRPHALMGYDCKQKWSATRERYPFLRSSAEEQTALFGRSSNPDGAFQAEVAADRLARRPQGKQHSATCVA